MMRIHKTKGAGDFIVVQLKPEDIFRIASFLYNSLEFERKIDEVFYNTTDKQQFRIEVKA
jgi:hypothetical protein